MSDRRGYAYVPGSEPSRGSQWSGSSPQSSRYPSQTNTSPGSYPHPYATTSTQNVAPVQPGPPVSYQMSHPPNEPLSGHHAGGYPSQAPNHYTTPTNTYLPRQPYPSPPDHRAQHDNNTAQYSPQTHMYSSPHSIPSYPPTSHFGTGTQYPASPARPYSCDLCALSFNRQHDLKRHRETHSGEKPFSCNGGCGKTFTRKDALKRHQLVKHCGHDDGA